MLPAGHRTIARSAPMPPGRAWLAMLALPAVAATAGAVVLYAGWYDVSATDQHLAPTFRLLDAGVRESLERRARSIRVPPLDDPALAARGLSLYRMHCVQCH